MVGICYRKSRLMVVKQRQREQRNLQCNRVIRLPYIAVPELQNKPHRGRQIIAVVLIVIAVTGLILVLMSYGWRPF